MLALQGPPRSPGMSQDPAVALPFPITSLRGRDGGVGAFSCIEGKSPPKSCQEEGLGHAAPEGRAGDSLGRNIGWGVPAAELKHLSSGGEMQLRPSRSRIFPGVWGNQPGAFEPHKPVQAMHRASHGLSNPKTVFLNQLLCKPKWEGVFFCSQRVTTKLSPIPQWVTNLLHHPTAQTTGEKIPMATSSCELWD